MEKNPKNSKPPLDRLSELPDSLIFIIFWQLPMRDVVRTTTLSRRWKNLWATAPYLNFDYCLLEDNIFLVRNFVTRTLMLWRGTRIQKLAIDLRNLSGRLLYTDLDLWLRCANERRVEELYLDLEYDADCSVEGTRNKLYTAPQGLYSCSSLEKLYLKGCNLAVPNRNVDWSRLQRLRIDGYDIGEGLMRRVMSGCPNLEVLILCLMENHQNLTIESWSLKNLFIDKYLYSSDDDVSVETELVIEAPNLEVLNLVGIPYSRCSMKVPSLVQGNILFDAQRNYSHTLFSGNDFVGETLKKILPAIQHVEQVEFSDWCIKALGAMKNVYTLSPFPNVKLLKLNSSFEEYEEIVHLLEIFPGMENLVLQQEKANNKEEIDKGKASPLKFEENILCSSCLQELRKITIPWDTSENSIFPLIGVLLKYASKLEKMVFRIKQSLSSTYSSLLLVAKVQSMPRSSPTVEFIFM